MHFQTHDREMDASEHFARSHPQASTLLIDTFDTEAAARSLVRHILRLWPL